MGLRPATRARLGRYWADRLGCDPAALSGDGVHVVALEAGPRGDVQVMVRPNAVVVATPPDRTGAIRGRAEALRGDPPGDPTAVAARLGLDIDTDTDADTTTALGPQFIGYADDRTLAPVHDPDDDGVRPLRPRDARALAGLRAATPAAEWRDRVGGFAIGAHDGLLGRFQDGELVAVAAYGADDAVAGLAVLTHPAHRGAGHGSVAVSAAAARALEEGLVPEYRLNEDWTASRSLAAGLGFRRYATRFVFVLD